MTEKVFQIIPTVQNYAWGKIGTHSKVAELISNAYPEIEIDNSKPYAEVIIYYFLIYKLIQLYSLLNTNKLFLMLFIKFLTIIFIY